VLTLAKAAGEGRRVSVQGSHGSSASLVAGAVARLSGRLVLMVVAHLDDADEASEELRAAGVDAVRFPALEMLPGESNVSIDLFGERLGVMRRVMGGTGTGVIVCPIQALMQGVPRPETLDQLTKTLRIGDDFGPGALSRWLEQAGYERLDAIEEPGDFAVRGGIVDVFPPSAGTRLGGAGVGGTSSAMPVRIDFFGDTVDRISEIDLDTMASDRAVQMVDLVSASLDRVQNDARVMNLLELVDLSRGAQALGDGGAGDAMGGGDATRRVAEPENPTRRVGPPKAESQDPTRRVGLPGAKPEDPTRRVGLPGAVPGSPIVVLHETLEVTEQARGYFERVSDARGIFAPPVVMKLLQERFGFVELNQFSGARIASDVSIELEVSPLPPISRDAGEAVKEVAALTQAHRVCVFCQNGGELQRLGELIDEFAPEAKSTIEAQVQYVHRGFVWGRDGGSDGATEARSDEGKNSSSSPSSLRRSTPSSLLLLPYHELLHRYEVRGGRRVGGPGSSGGGTQPKLRAGRAIDTFLDFGVADYVVHRDHGIAKFLGLHVMASRQIQRDIIGKDLDVLLPGSKAAKHAEKKAQRLARKGKTGADEFAGMEEFLVLEFAKGTKLYVPATKIDQVQKYVGGFRGAPQLSALGGDRWKNQKDRVGEAVRDLAGEMLRIRAAREHLPGIRFPADTAWQKEFEAEFPYDETEDQLAAMVEIKRDMSSPRPMDRLICGDVGFGKTELAIRAAFKAVEFGKQVAILVPTTVLAEQHGRTFSSRFADYPFRVESISRFKSTKEENDILARLRKGQVDVIIGTHRLLSKDVKFADLGLVVIDEEQRFGVEHKERLLSLRMTVDVMTLSATPIPRTLHLSMLGLRDISSLTTAPMDRRAVVTEVIPYNKRRIEAAIARELARDGQIFFVHNRVHNIKSVADEIQKMAPGARVVIGHGQMPDGELEDVMLTFMRGNADILVSTTIIESGIDIATANTMIINDADRFGLSDLHQLRGRVGRYKHRAYCYLLLPEDRSVNEKAVKRLKAIEEFSMLGAGFKIAMRDLEIRGAGNILGPEQSGHIATVGYEMYCQLLDRAVKELKNEAVVIPSETSVEIGVTGLIPKAYIPSDLRRMEAYRRIALAASIDEIERVEAELKQAYSEPPAPAQRLLELAEVRIGANMLEIRSLTLRGPDVILRVPPHRMQEVVNRFKGEGAEGAREQGIKGGGSRGGPPSTSAWHVVGFPPKKGEESCEVYARPPAAYLEGGEEGRSTLLAVLRKRVGARSLRS